MTDSHLKAGSQPAPPAAQQPRAKVSKNQRKELLAQIERQSSRADSPERILQRAEQSLNSGHIDQARRLLKELESSAPSTQGLSFLQERIDRVDQAKRLKSNLRKAEEMLMRYIQQRKKALAELALETLLEIAPDHPRRQEFEIWVGDLDEELAVQRQIDTELRAGLAALRADEIEKAQRHLEILRHLDPHAPATQELARELAVAAQGQAESADIEHLKRRVEELLASGQLDEAAQRIERLARLDVPKVTVDFLRKRLEEARGQVRDREDAEELTNLYNIHLVARDWQRARDVAHKLGQRFPDRPDAAEMFNKVTEMEGAERRKQSIEQGVATLETLIAERKRQDAEVALKLLERLELNADQLNDFKHRVAKL